jgi:hypothetical protein
MSGRATALSLLAAALALAAGAAAALLATLLIHNAL